MEKNNDISLGEFDRLLLLATIDDTSTSKTHRRQCLIILLVDISCGEPINTKSIALRCCVSEKDVNDAINEFCRLGLFDFVSRE